MKLYEIDLVTGCWNWQRGTASNGYGHIRLNAKNWTAHRLVWAIFNNTVVDPRMDICHTCDNRRCINPAHLFLGTRAENVQDCCRKGRILTKLSADQVLQIRQRISAGEIKNRLAKEFGVSPTLIGYIHSRRAWKHL